MPDKQLSWDDAVKPLRRKKLKIVPVYGLRNNYTGRALEVQFSTPLHTRKYIKERNLNSKEFRVTILGKRGMAG